MNFVLKIFLFAAGLVFALSLVVMMLVLLVLWGFRALWCKLTGKPILPFAMRMNPRSGFDKVFQTRRPAKAPKRDLSDVTDVEPKR